MNVTAQDIISILSIFATIVIGIRSFLWSKDYRNAKQAELDAKEADYQAKESGYKSQLETKEASIKFLKLITDPKYVDKVEKLIDEQKLNINKLQETIQQLKNQLTEANSQNDGLKTEIAKLSISDNERDNLIVFTTGSSTTLNGLDATTDEFVEVERIELELLDRINQFKSFEVKIPTNEWVTRMMEEQYKRLMKEAESHDDESSADGEET